MDASARFCTQCGQPLADSVPPPASPEAPDQGDETDPPGPGAEDHDTEGDDPTDLAMPVGEATQSVDVQLEACPRCGASNAVRRVRCGRCGSRLDGVADRGPRDTPPTGNRVPESPQRPPPSRAPAVDARRARRRRGAAVAIVVVGLVVGAGLGLAAGMDVGPFAEPTEVEFDPEAYPSEPSGVSPVTTGASSTRTGAGERSFGPRSAVDEDLLTAWVPRAEDAEPRLVHRFDAPVWIDRIEVATGLGQDAGAEGVGRTTGARIDLRGLRVEATLEDTGGMQLIQLPDPVLVEEVTWLVTSTVDGTGSIAEVRYRGWPADEDDRDSFHGR